jgi:hypothetical protein
MAINFPNSPIVGQTYTFNEKTWQWSGSYWEVFSAQTGYVQGAINVGGGEEVFSGKSGNDLYFRTLTGGTNTTISTVGDLIKVDVTIPPDTNTFVTGFTYDDANTFTITRNDDVGLSSTINNVTGLTINGNLVVTGTTNISGITTVDSTLQVDGNVNITSNSFFFQGTSVGSSNVSLIGVDSSDVIRIGNLGYDNYIEDDTTINGVLTADTVFLATLPTLNNSGTDILVRNSSTGEVEYRPVSGITPDTNTFVTGGTYNPTTDVITLTRNDDVTIDVTGVTDNFVVAGSYSDSTDTISLLRQDGSFVNITGVTDTFTTGATYDNGTSTATFTKNDNTTYTLDLSTIDVNDTFVTGSTVSANTLTVSRNDLQNVLELSGGTNIQFIDNGNNSITVNATSGGGGASVSFPWKFKEPTAAADPGSGQFRLNSAVASGITEIYVNDETNNGIDASNFLNIIDTGDIIYIQQNDDASRALLFSVSAATTDNTGWFTIPVEYLQGSTLPKKDKICGWIFASTGAEDNTVSNVGVGQGVFKQRNVNDFEFYSLSGGSNTTLSLNNDTIVIDVAIPPATNTFVTGFTYDNNNTFTISRSDDVDITSTFNQVSGLTVNGDLLVTGTTTASTLNLSSTPVENNDNTEILSRNSGSGDVEYRSVQTIGNNITTVTATTYSATTIDDVIGFDTSSVTPTLFLPDSTSSGTKRYEVKDIGVNSRRNPITIQAAGSDTIITTSVVSSFELSADGGAVILVSTGSGQWWQM